MNRDKPPIEQRHTSSAPPDSTVPKAAVLDWHARAKSVIWSVRPLIDGHYRDSDATEAIAKINPSTETVLYHMPVGCPEDIDLAVGAARKRFEDGCWSELTPEKRKGLLFKFAELISARKDELALLDTLEMGKPISASLTEAEWLATEHVRSAAEWSDKLMGSVAHLGDSTVAFNVFEPRGVIGAIIPWNFPVLNAVMKIGPALAAGNTLVLKPSEIASSSALKLAEIALEAGIPPGVLNVVPGLGRTVGAALAAHPDVDLLAFTGSTLTGRKLMTLASESNGKPLLLECGGKGPSVVFPDADNLEAVAAGVVSALFNNQGQVCVALSRLLVHESIKESLLERIIERARQLHPADPLSETTTFGPLASPARRDRVRDYIEEGLRAGAKALLGGRSAVQGNGGCYVSPTIFDCVSNTLAIVQDEIFGPVLCVQTFQSEQEAIELANSTAYGLLAAVWTRDAGRSKRLARAIRASGIAIYTSGTDGPYRGSTLSCNPQKASGFGAELGLKGLESYSNLKLVYLSGT